MSASTLRLSVGGKGLDSSVALKHLNIQTQAFCFLAGRTGKELLALISDRYGFPITAKWVQGSTRSAYIVSEVKHKTHSHIFTGGIKLTTEDETGLLAEFLNYLPRSSYVILGGIFPETASPHIYTQFIDQANQVNIPTLIDAHTQYMLPALSTSPTIVKQNRYEFSQTFRVEAATFPTLIEVGKQVYQDRNLKNLVITCGKDGLLAFTPQGSYHAQPPELKAVNAAGAGDAASAALAWKQTERADWPNTLKWAAAVSAAVVLTEGTADLHLEDVHKILPKVTVNEV